MPESRSGRELRSGALRENGGVIIEVVYAFWCVQRPIPSQVGLGGNCGVRYAKKVGLGRCRGKETLFQVYL